MKFEYVNSSTRNYIFLGVCFILLGSVALFFNTYWLQSYGHLFLGCLWLILGFYNKKKGYLSLEGDYLKRYCFPAWKVDLREVIKLKETRSGYELHTKNKTYKIVTGCMKYDSLQDLKSELIKLNIKDSSL